MPERPHYAILGRGQWAGRMKALLEAERCRVTCIPNPRRAAEETEESYRERLSAELRATGAQIAWLCVAPGPHVKNMVEAAIDAGVHALAEKPWLISRDETEEMDALAARGGIVLGMNFEYCLLDEIERWRERFADGRGLRFNGCFTTSRPDRLRLPAMLNLGCHLLAIKRYAVPEADTGEIMCAYDGKDERRVWIENDAIEFTHDRQPIIQRLLERFEAAIDGAAFPFGIRFAREVTEELAKCPAPQTAASHRL